jgi:GrpB-like predicted nucleotidyltransferase (UPF0157 family)
MKHLIVIAPYDPQWPLAFQRLGTPLHAALGDLALRIDHIGSTAVPGLSAKDVIDVQITVATLEKRTLVAAISHGLRNEPHCSAGSLYLFVQRSSFG